MAVVPRYRCGAVPDSHRVPSLLAALVKLTGCGEPTARATLTVANAPVRDVQRGHGIQREGSDSEGCPVGGIARGAVAFVLS